MELRRARTAMPLRRIWLADVGASSL